MPVGDDEEGEGSGGRSGEPAPRAQRPEEGRGQRPPWVAGLEMWLNLRKKYEPENMKHDKYQVQRIVLKNMI